MKDMARRIQKLYPTADLSPRGTVRVENNGSEDVLAQWDASLGPQPTEAQLLAVTPDPPRRPRPLAAVALEVHDWIQAPVTPTERLQRLSRVAAEALALALRGRPPRPGGAVPVDGTEPDV